MRLFNFEASRKPGYVYHKKSGMTFYIQQYSPNDLCKKFLSLKPRPIIQEHALHPMGWNLHKYKGIVPDSERQGKFKYDFQAYEKLLQEEIQKRREYMQKVIDSRTDNPAN